MQDRLSGMLGLLNKAGKLCFGEASIMGKLRKGSLLLIAKDASDRSRKTYLSKASSNGVEALLCLDKETLGKPLGRDEVTAVLLTDAKASAKIKSLVEEKEREDEEEIPE